MRISARCREHVKNGVVAPQHQNAGGILNDFNKNVNLFAPEWRIKKLGKV
jgi:hypothetical protein